MKFKIVLSFFFSILLLISCNNADKQDKTVAEVPNDSIGRYLYLANSGVLHTSDSCYKLLIDKDSKGHEVIGYEFIDTMTVHDLNCLYCKQCFSDAKYEHLKKIEIRNGNLYKLYEALTQEYIDIPQTFEGFAHWFYSENGDSVQNSKELYNSINGSNCINYKSYKKFIDELNSENYNIAISEGNYNE